jgi:Fur family peroxide stress response transcriptional regulator
MKNAHSSIVQVRNYLVKAGINPSFQRLKIYEYFMKNGEHPTVDMIYNKLSKEIPTLSKTTIYNNLNLFHQKGIVSELTIEENEIRYDHNMTPHAHFKCNDCGEIFDIPAQFPAIRSYDEKGHHVKEMHFYLKGVCKSCVSTSAQSSV